MGDGYVDHAVVYRDKSGQWRWRAVAGNGEVVSEGEAHTRPEDAARAARGVLGDKVTIRLEAETPVEVTDGPA